MESMTLTIKVSEDIQQLKEQRKLCEQKIDEYEDKINETKNIIKQINLHIRNTCPKHIWKTEREEGMYGEKFTYCTICGSDYAC